MASELFLGLDIGTSSVKAVLVSPSGDVVAVASSPLDLQVPAPGRSEQRPEDWWDATVTATRTALAEAGDVTVRAIGLSGQMHSLVTLDASGQTVRPAILWNDVRSTEQCAQVRDRVGNERLLALAGNPALEGFTATKLLWLQQNEPQNFDRVATALLPKDYVRFRLTGELATEPSDAAATLLFDVRQGKWSEEMLQLLSIDPGILPPVFGSSQVAGTITPGAAKLLGIREGTPVVAGGADNACAAAGAGVVSPGQLLVSVGTSGTVVAPVAEPLTDPGMRVHLMNHIEPDSWYLMGVVLSAGAALAWWQGSVSGDSGSPGFSELVQEADAVSAGSEALTFLPYLTGERTPYADADARGVFAGMNATHTRGHMTRAVLEGVALALRDSLRLIQEIGATPGQAVAVGGGAQSATWLQIQADVLGLPLETVGPAEGAPLGAAMLAAVGAGEFDSISEAGSAWLKSVGRAEPDAANAGAYDDAYSRYQSLYQHMKDWFKE